MGLGTLLTSFTPRDAVALAVFALAWGAIGLVIERPIFGRRSVTVMMADIRRAWMRQFAQRDVRIFDSQILSSLRQGTAFFASSVLLAIGGVLTVVGNVDGLTAMGGGLLRERPVEVMQVKLLLVAALLSDAFLRFVWANRVFGYCAVVMGSVPEPREPTALAIARQAAELNIRAATNFNRGLRSIYFGLAALAWLLGPIALMVATAVCVGTLLEREFTSNPHRILKEREAER